MVSFFIPHNQENSDVSFFENLYSIMINPFNHVVQSRKFIQNFLESYFTYSGLIGS